MSYTHSYIYIDTAMRRNISYGNLRGCGSHICSFFHIWQVLKQQANCEKLAIINKDVADLTKRNHEIS